MPGFGARLRGVLQPSTPSPAHPRAAKITPRCCPHAPVVPMHSCREGDNSHTVCTHMGSCPQHPQDASSAAGGLQGDAGC